MNSIILEVFIGLILTYLLYSMFATIIMEVIASTLGLRAENLHYALKRMLMDEKVEDNIWTRYFQRTLNSFTQIFGKSPTHTNPKLFDDFINQPVIKYLGNGGSLITNRTPSYLTSETFSKALIDSLKGDPEDFEELETSTILEMNILNMPEKSDTRKFLYSLLRDSDRDVQKFKLKLEMWFDDTMERAKGWYKRTTQLFIFIISFGLVVIFNVDTIHIAKRLSQDEVIRKEYLKLAEHTATSKNSLNTSLGNLLQKTNHLNYLLEQPQFCAKVEKNWLGLALSILALSLGAPFWFDLLNKFVKLKSGFFKSSDDESEKKTIINRVG